MKRWAYVLMGIAALQLTGSADAQVLLTFEGVGNGAAVNGFYAGGTDSLGNAGPNFGVQFAGGTLGLVDEDAGGTGNFANEPSSSTIVFFTDPGTAFLNVASGFVQRMSFYYSSAAPAVVSLYSGLDGTGALLGTVNLLAQYDAGCVGDPNGDFCRFSRVSIGFSGTARSIDFSATANQTGIDNITLGVPEPATWMYLIAGIGMTGASLRRRRNSAASGKRLLLGNV